MTNEQMGGIQSKNNFKKGNEERYIIYEHSVNRVNFYFTSTEIA